MGGDHINYPGKVATPIADMISTKMLFNSVAPTKGAKCITFDISNFYVITPIKQPEYI